MRPLALALSDAQASATGAIEEEARRLRRAGRRVLSFAEGEPDVPTPAGIRAAAASAMDAGATRYTDPTGTMELREAIGADLDRRGVGRYAPDEVVVTAGAKAAIYHALAVLCDPGDEVIIPTPCWVSFPEQVRLLRGRPVLVPCDARFLPDEEAVARALTPRTKALILNTPNNPTGAVYPPDLVARLVRLCAARGIYTILDIVYERFTYVSPSGAGAPEPRDAVVLVNSFSKTYAMTGWRLGYAAGPRTVIGAVGVLQSHTAGNPNAVAQAAALWALAHSTDYTEMRETYRRRRDLMTSGLQTLPGVRCTLPDGAFYVFADVRGVYPMIPATYAQSAAGVARWWLREAGVATVPGEPFDGPGHVRLCYASSNEQIAEGLQRLAELLDSRLSQAGEAKGAR
jgi:aspartate aminotransferase